MPGTTKGRKKAAAIVREIVIAAIQISARTTMRHMTTVRVWAIAIFIDAITVWRSNAAMTPKIPTTTTTGMIATIGTARTIATAIEIVIETAIIVTAADVIGI